MREPGSKGLLLLALCAGLLFNGCDRNDQQIKVYRVSKAPLESTPPPMDSNLPPNASMPTNASSPSTPAVAPPQSPDTPQIQWDVPPEWSSVPPSAMRYASFATEKNGEKADISVVTFPGEGGSDADNVNRWRGQIGLGPVSSVESMVVRLQAGNHDFLTVDMAGTNTRMLAGWIRHEGRSWFFKLTGPPALVEQEKPKFTAFLQSVRF
ncbi:MAG TPA: hypothetical protein VK474_02390 [Chthoniobacterales bacterium]|nr:hypothetical protein [Chthoniobacterales bacterium]